MAATLTTREAADLGRAGHLDPDWTGCLLAALHPTTLPPRPMPGPDHALYANRAQVYITARFVWGRLLGKPHIEQGRWQSAADLSKGSLCPAAAEAPPAGKEERRGGGSSMNTAAVKFCIAVFVGRYDRGRLLRS